MNNYLNNTLTNLHLQDFLKEKGLDVSHLFSIIIHILSRNFYQFP